MWGKKRKTNKNGKPRRSVLDQVFAARRWRRLCAHQFPPVLPRKQTTSRRVKSRRARCEHVGHGTYRLHRQGRVPVRDLRLVGSAMLRASLLRVAARPHGRRRRRKTRARASPRLCPRTRPRASGPVANARESPRVVSRTGPRQPVVSVAHRRHNARDGSRACERGTPWSTAMRDCRRYPERSHERSKFLRRTQAAMSLRTRRTPRPTVPSTCPNGSLPPPGCCVAVFAGADGVWRRRWRAGGDKRKANPKNTGV